MARNKRYSWVSARAVLRRGASRSCVGSVGGISAWSGASPFQDDATTDGEIPDKYARNPRHTRWGSFRSDIDSKLGAVPYRLGRGADIEAAVESLSRDLTAAYEENCPLRKVQGWSHVTTMLSDAESEIEEEVLLLFAIIEDKEEHERHRSTAEVNFIITRVSSVLLAVVDAKYNFLYVNIGCQGRISDGGVFNNCELNEKIQNNALNIPEPTALPPRTEEVPFYFVGDEAFALSENMMKVYSGYQSS
ncbi:unnamed protein product [Acanthoscelides obtectus]|uniref:DDE Tnp4 domain-containing protein n=1 Tax=Acanthoscelides obtectus TaxID=200917 RepID=A0A9P0LJX5_ACAOB|nr:unnamed protein product [Acanthoscelides obtectus]CAK1672315.1 hypothetical protein AOBTE_LOCUS28778 [Acanthoscelides obtectus]